MAPKANTAIAQAHAPNASNRKLRGSGHERLAEILAAAKALFLESGFENVSTRLIAEKVGISQTALFAYYKNKDAIFHRLVTDAWAEVDQAISDIERSEDDRAWFRQAIARYIYFGLSHPDEYRLALMVTKAYRTPYNVEAPQQPGEAVRAGVPVFLRLVAKINQAMAAGRIRQDLGSPTQVGQALWASIHGLVAALIARPRPQFPWEDTDILIRLQTDILLDGLFARPQQKPKAAKRTRKPSDAGAG